MAIVWHDDPSPDAGTPPPSSAPPRVNWDQTTPAPAAPGIRWDQSGGAAPAQQGGLWSGKPDPLGFLAGLAQGVLGLGEESNRLALKGIGALTGLPLDTPQWYQNTFGLRQRAERNSAGRVAETLGGILPYVAQPEAAAPKIASNVPSILRYGGNVLRRSTLPGLLQQSDPNTQHYGRDKAIEGALSTLFGEGVHGAGALAGKLWGAMEKSDAARALADRLRYSNERIKEENVARVEQGRAGREARETERYNEGVARDQAEQARRAVPEQTTRMWWEEALAPTGDTDKLPATIGPDTSGKVQKIVGDRMNAALDQMSFPSDPTFGLTLRDQTSRAISSSNRDSWESTFNTLVTQKLAKVRGGALSGEEYRGFVMDIGAKLQQMSQRIRSEAMPQIKEDLITQRNALQNIFDAAQDRAIGSQAAKAQLANARRGYNLWSIGNNATGARWGGVIEPADLAAEWEGRQGQARYSAEMDPENPAFHAENAHLKRWIEERRRAHQDRPAPATRQAPYRPPRPFASVPTPPPTEGSTLEEMAGRILARTAARGAGPVRHFLPWDLIGRATRTVGKPVAGAVADPLRRAAPGVSATTGATAQEFLNWDRRP